MSPRARLATFGLLLALMFGAGASLAVVVDPLGTWDRSATPARVAAPHSMPGMDMSDMDMSGATGGR